MDKLLHRTDRAGTPLGIYDPSLLSGKTGLANLKVISDDNSVLEFQVNLMGDPLPPKSWTRWWLGESHGFAPVTIHIKRPQ